MAAYHVFVDGAGDPTPAGQEQLATAIATHYGMPVDAVRARIASGRFRVKGNCDRATADSYVRDLTKLGAVCSVEEATSANVAKTPLPFPATRPPAQTTPPAVARSSSKNYQSGLSAAFTPPSGDQPVASLGALEEMSALKLSSVDGNDDRSSAPDEKMLNASFGPPPEAKKPAAPAKPANDPIDMFAPPDADDANFAVDLAPEEVERSAKKRASIPPENAPVERTSSPSIQAPNRQSNPSIQPPNRKSTPSIQAPTIASGPKGIREPRARFAVGVLLAIGIGFIPATLVASSREKSAYKDIDDKVVALQANASTPEEYASLDGMRAKQLEHKKEARRTAALLAFLIWGVVGGGVAFAWFKKIVPPEA
ncbi:MAG: hypothetical protein QM831_16325 [Kofleriaceae bacterium]